MRKPNFFIAGAPRCGTTALYTYLSQHPAIFMPEVKELNYFATDFPNVQKVTFRSEADYLRMFASAQEHHLALGEASPFYLYSRTAFENLFAFQPQAKIILSLRNPVDFVHSYHRLNLSLLREDQPDLLRAWELQAARKRGEAIPPSARHPELLMYGELGQYSRYVERLLAIFPRQQVKIILFDDLQADTRAVYEEILAFVGVPSDGRTVFPRVNASFENKSRLLAQIFHPPQPVYRAFMGVISLFGVRFTRLVSVVYNRLERLNTRTAQRQALPPEVRRRLQEHFAPDIQRLSTLIGRDLHMWLKEPPPHGKASTTS
ncbi:MAG TPA: sulfotransferase [Chloroflexi bacterium]|nr:sulfotransferase [Chloroflexota bacterium]